MHQVSLIRRSGAAKTVQAYVLLWHSGPYPGASGLAPTQKQVRRNGFDQQVLAGAAFQS